MKPSFALDAERLREAVVTNYDGWKEGLFKNPHRPDGLAAVREERQEGLGAGEDHGMRRQKTAVVRGTRKSVSTVL